MNGATPEKASSARKKAVAAGPQKDVQRVEAVEPDTLTKMLEVIIGSLEDDKAEDIVTIDLTGRANFADRMVIATGFVDRQIASMAHHIDKKLAEIGFKRVLVEGANGSDWVLLDAGYVVVHLFKPESREMYGLEKMWGADLDAVEAELPVGKDSEAS
ncbi:MULTISPECIES: ribosome silencing factor [Neokomagataea]|nr:MULTISPECIES: ribosome silencing factor [Neokomagataea]